MKRTWGWRILICLLLGVITTIAVAWSCGLLSELDVGTEAFWYTGEVDSAERRGFELFSAVGVDDVTVHRPPTNSELALIASDVPLLPGSYTPPTPLEDPPVWGPLRHPDLIRVDARVPSNRAFVAQGWPWRVLWCERHTVTSEITGGVRLSIEPVGATALKTVHVLAFRPSWPEFALCTALYGSVWMVLLFVPGALRRFVRRRRGRCVTCGYDLRATTGEVCPECGTGFAPLAA